MEVDKGFYVLIFFSSIILIGTIGLIVSIGVWDNVSNEEIIKISNYKNFCEKQSDFLYECTKGHSYRYCLDRLEVLKIIKRCEI